CVWGDVETGRNRTSCRTMSRCSRRCTSRCRSPSTNLYTTSEGRLDNLWQEAETRQVRVGWTIFGKKQKHDKRGGGGRTKTAVLSYELRAHHSRCRYCSQHSTCSSHRSSWPR